MVEIASVTARPRGFSGIVGGGSGSPRALVMSKAAHESDKKGGIWTCFQALWQFYAVRVGGGGNRAGRHVPGRVILEICLGGLAEGKQTFVDK